MRTEYEWKDGARVAGLDADVVGGKLQDIQRRDGAITPEAVVKEAKKKTSPLHPAFEWDDAAAAHEHRLTQARSLIRSVVIRIIGGTDEEPKITRAFVHVAEAYEDIHTVLASVDKRTALLAKALAEFDAVRRKYADLEEMASVYEALDQLAA